MTRLAIRQATMVDGSITPAVSVVAIRALPREVTTRTAVTRLAIR
ncbi:MAG TPA: hypothetical protein VFI27_18790 [candidate division Zixibacteria bacterium]|nr:hypothetical protein [candidate division Zixibacteria bacterium]